MTEIAQNIDLNLQEKLKNPAYRSRFFLAESSALIAKQLIALRKRRNLDQKQLADKLGTKQPAISRIEQASYQSWNFSTLRSIADELGARIRVYIQPYEDVLKEYADEQDSSDIPEQGITYIQNTDFEATNALIPFSGLMTGTINQFNMFSSTSGGEITNTPYTVGGLPNTSIVSLFGLYTPIIQDEKDRKIAELQTRVADLERQVDYWKTAFWNSPSSQQVQLNNNLYNNTQISICERSQGIHNETNQVR